MLLHAIEASAFGTNCWVLAQGPRQECVVVDPGFGVVDRLEAFLRAQGLRPAAVLLTHGHADHVWSVTPVCQSADAAVAVHIHPDDRYRLTDPLAQLAPEVRHMLASMFGPAEQWQEPDTVVALPDSTALNSTALNSTALNSTAVGNAAGNLLTVAGIDLAVHHTPGHTEGSVVFHVETDDAPLLLSGDLLFAGSIGRSDLAGGDPVAMTESLRDVLPRFSEDTVVLPGHGARTTLATEWASNPFLTSLRRQSPDAGGR